MPDPIWFHFKIFNVTTSAKTLFTNKVPFTVMGGKVFEGPLFDLLHGLRGLVWPGPLFPHPLPFFFLSCVVGIFLFLERIMEYLPSGLCSGYCLYWKSPHIAKCLTLSFPSRLYSNPQTSPPFLTNIFKIATVFKLHHQLRHSQLFLSKPTLYFWLL